MKLSQEIEQKELTQKAKKLIDQVPPGQAMEEDDEKKLGAIINQLRVLGAEEQASQLQQKWDAMFE